MLDGKVAIVTGAARGLGKVEALELARLGARVVVNDLGTAADGSGKDEEPARAVVEEIKSMGGEAVPHFGDVAVWSDAESLIQTAVEGFGDLHILLNNAGFCRDKMIFNMTEEEWDTVIRVHMKGHFSTTRFAAAYWRNQSKAAGGPIYGRLISTASEAFIFGSVGQPNYAAAKAGIVAMTMSAAQALIRYGVTANVIMPRARTRMNDSGMLAEMFAKPAEGFDTFAPENVSPLVGYLASPMAERISGQVFVIWGKHVTVVGRPSTDTRFESQDAWSVENLHQQLGPHFEKLEPVTDGFIVPPA
jgi:3-oxoacyl-[acyl-carrier protein] reductase